MTEDPYYNEKECPECGDPCSVFDELCEKCKDEKKNIDESDENMYL